MPFREKRAVLRRAGKGSDAGMRGPNQAQQAAGRTSSSQRRGRPNRMDRRDGEDASCAQGQAGIVRLAPHCWGQGGDAAQAKVGN